MKCKYCGGPLRIEDEICPHCLKSNPDAGEHRRKMAKFSGEYARTRDDVYAQTKHYTGWTVRVAVISVLVVLNILLLFLHSESWSIAGAIRLMKVNANYEAYAAQVEQLEREGRFMEFANVFEANDLRDDERFDTYSQVAWAADQYSYLYDYIVSVATLDEDSYETPERLAEYIADGLEYVYRYMDEDERWDESQYTPERLAAMDQMVEELHLLLKTYWNVSEEDLERFPQMSSARRQIILEEGVGIGR